MEKKHNSNTVDVWPDCSYWWKWYLFYTVTWNPHSVTWNYGSGPEDRQGECWGSLLEWPRLPQGHITPLPEDRHQATGVAVRYWSCFLNLSQLAFCKENFWFGYQFQNALPMGNLFFEMESMRSQMGESRFISQFRCEAGDGWAMHLLGGAETKEVQPGHVAHPDPWLCHGTYEWNPSVLGSGIPRVYITPTWEELELLNLSLVV